MRVTAKAEYALRAAIALAAHDGGSVKAEQISADQLIPLPFLAKILATLRTAGLVVSTRGPEGGHRLARPADRITLGEVLRVVDGPYTEVAGRRIDDLDTATDAAVRLADVWRALDAAAATVLDGVTLAMVATGQVPEWVDALGRAASPSALLEAHGSDLLWG